MASRTTICSPAEVLAALGKAGTATEDDYGIIQTFMPLVDGAINTFLGWIVVQNSYTAILPDTDLFDAIAYNSAWDLGEPFDAINGRIAYAYPGMPQILQVPNIPLRSVTSLKADFSSAGGQNANDFSSATLLNLGTDYYVDYDAPSIGGTVPYLNGVSWSGHIRRWLGGVWPARMRSAQVVYTSGVTPDELDSEQAFPVRDIRTIKHAAILANMLSYKELKAWGGGGTGTSGPIIAERLADYSVTYSEAAILAAIGMMGGLPFKVQELLRPFCRSHR